ncbi:Uncharacterized protein Adt_18278 [Abeliophyllum distichum]|uniref:Uncharacterized protein n=1 Tax=Abeliophyllum distichum TaxID=126358 RepID=A0ABD1TJ76_9LAMI
MEMSDPITITLTNVAEMHFSHNDTLVVREVVTKNSLGRMLGLYHSLRNYYIDDRDERDTNDCKDSLEYLLDDKISSFHDVIGRPVLIDLGAVTYTKFLYIKFSMDRGITAVKKNQSESRACYTNIMRKFMDKEVNVVDVEIKESPSI